MLKKHYQYPIYMLNTDERSVFSFYYMKTCLTMQKRGLWMHDISFTVRIETHSKGSNPNEIIQHKWKLNKTHQIHENLYLHSKSFSVSLKCQRNFMGKFNWLVNNTEWNFYEKFLSFCQIFFKGTEYLWPFLEYIDLLKRKNCELR